VKTVHQTDRSASMRKSPSDVPRPPDGVTARLRQLRVALVHDWLVTLGGADRVLLALHEVFPQAPVFVGLHDLRRLPDSFRQLDVRATWLQQIPGAAQRHRLLVPLMPLAFGHLVLRGYDVVISSSHACAHSVSVPGALHICYCHTPMRYAWDLRGEYLAALPGVARPAARLMLAWLRRRDRAAAEGVDQFIANSQHVASRIRRHYGREATVIYPPVDTEFFTPTGDPAEESTQSSQSAQSSRSTAESSGDRADREDFYLVVSRLVPYKRVDVAVEAFNRLDRRLVIVGDGPERGRLQSMSGPHVRFVGELGDAALRRYYRQCRALVFPGEEDFGLVPVEAQACGRPVIAYRRGGALESVAPGVTGIFFAEQTPDALMAGIRAAEATTFDAAAIRRHTMQFSQQRFTVQIAEFVAAALTQSRSRAVARSGPSESRITNHESP